MAKKVKVTLLAELIADLSASEQQEARSWLACTAHNRRTDLRRLFDCYLAYDQEDGPGWWPQLYDDGRSYRERDFRLLRSYLLDCLEEWLSYRRWKEVRLAQVDASLLEQYRNRGLERLYLNRLKRARKALARRPLADLWTAYRVETQQFDLDAGRRRLEEHNLKERDQLLDAAVIRTKLRAACQTLSTRTLRGSATDIPLLTECLQLAAQPPFRQHIGIEPYRLACRWLLQADENEADFYTYFNWLDEQLDAYVRDEQRDLLRLGINYCVGRINQDRHDFMRPALELYRLLLDRDLAYEGGELSPFTFNNVIGIALRLGEVDWVQSFLQHQAERLPAQERAPLQALNTARLALARQDYDGVLVALRESDYRDFIHQMSARTLQLKAYWALDLYHLTSNHLRNTRAMLRRKRDTSYHATNYRNLFELADQILRLQPGDEVARQKVRQLVYSTSPLPERDWLLQLLKKP